jgi:hypothetical protein
VSNATEAHLCACLCDADYHHYDDETAMAIIEQKHGGHVARAWKDSRDALAQSRSASAGADVKDDEVGRDG